MLFKELEGSKLKRELGILRVRKTYHNKHRDNSGNFGFVLVRMNPTLALKEQWFMLNGDYDPSGTIYNLSFGDYASLGTQYRLAPITYENLIKALKQLLEGILK